MRLWDKERVLVGGDQPIDLEEAHDARGSKSRTKRIGKRVICPGALHFRTKNLRQSTPSCLLSILGNDLTRIERVSATQVVILEHLYSDRTFKPRHRHRLRPDIGRL